jgi:hypothetical protein
MYFCTNVLPNKEIDPFKTKSAFPDFCPLVEEDN